MKTLTENEFDKEHPLKANHLEDNAAWGGDMFETYGQEFEHIRSLDPHNVWTWVDSNDGAGALLNGVHLCDRIGYLVSDVKWTEDTTVELDNE